MYYESVCPLSTGGNCYWNDAAAGVQSASARCIIVCATVAYNKKGPETGPFGGICRCILTLGVLEPRTSGTQTIFFPFFFASVTGKQPGFFQYAPQRGVNGKQGAGNAVPHSFSLTGDAAAVNGDLNVNFVEQFAGEYQLSFRFDPQSLLQHYNGIFTNAAFERMTGINQRQLQRYASGVSKPLRPQAEKIASALHKLGKELSVVEL